MAESFLLGLDIGTQGAKGILCDRDGVVFASAYLEHDISSPFVGWAEQNAEQDWWGALVALTNQLLSQSGISPSKIAGVGVSAFVPATLPVDGAGMPLRPAILYTDKRSQTELSDLLSLLDQAGLSGEDIGQPDLASPVVQLLWIRKNEPEVYRRTERIFQCQNYLVYRLTGEVVIDHAMKRSYTPLYDIDKDSWSTERAQLLEIDLSWLPGRISWATEIAGTITSQSAEETGLAEGTPVAVGTADAFAEMIGAGVVEGGLSVAIYGSFTAILIGQEQPVSRWHGYHCLPDLYFSGAAVPTGAILTRWFRDQFGSREYTSDYQQDEKSYAKLDQGAARIPPGCNGLIAIPEFSGTKSRLHPILNSGALIGLTLKHTREHIYRSLLEGIAYELLWQLSKEGTVPSHMVAVGGGAASLVWPQIFSDLLDATQDILAIPYSAPFGDAYLAGLAAGLFDSTIPLIESWIQIQNRLEPNPENREVYQTNYAAYCAARDVLLA